MEAEALQIGSSSELGRSSVAVGMVSATGEASLAREMHSRQQVGRSEGVRENGVREEGSPLRRRFQVPPAFNV